MRWLAVFFCVVNFCTSPLQAKGASHVSDYQIAVAVREAVRAADSTLLNAASLNSWRDYLKIAATNLQLPIQPLVLIKFDEDASFRNQLKTIIQWESQWQSKETEHFIYYYRWDQPPPEIILPVQDAHFNEVVKLFGLNVLEKIPFRYDLTANSSRVYPYEDLRGGVVSSQPFDLYHGALAILNFINPEPDFLLRPLAKIHGSYFQNPSTSEAYYDNCKSQVTRHGYVSPTVFLEYGRGRTSSTAEEASVYVFIFDLLRDFGIPKIKEFLVKLGSDISVSRFRTSFQETFVIDLDAFETRYYLSAQK